MNAKQKGMIFGAFIGDSLALGVHWVYNTRAIDKKLGRVTDLLAPIVKTFHPNKKSGEFTHYGDQMLLFLKFILSSDRSGRNFDPHAFLEEWSSFFDAYEGYKDHAMKDTRENIARGEQAGSQSSDLAGIIYVPALVLARDADDDRLLQEVETAVAMTHNNPHVKEAAHFFAAVLRKVFNGNTPMESIEKALDREFYSSEIVELIQKGQDSIGKNSRESISNFGQACSVEHGLPGVVHIIGSYENDFETALIENVMAGGDSASRGIFIGAVLGAFSDIDGIPKRWRDGLAAKDTIAGLSI